MMTERYKYTGSIGLSLLRKHRTKLWLMLCVIVVLFFLSRNKKTHTLGESIPVDTYAANKLPWGQDFQRSSLKDVPKMMKNFLHSNEYIDEENDTSDYSFWPSSQKKGSRHKQKELPHLQRKVPAPNVKRMQDIIVQYRRKGHATEQPINDFDCGYKINPEDLCAGKNDIRVLFVVKTSPRHIDRRNAIRKTWGNSERFPKMRTVFSLGIPKNYKIESLYEESKTNNDILLVNYLDDYFNLTLKTINGMRWAVNHCSRAAFVVSIDDDVYVAPDLLVKYLKKLPHYRTHKLYSGFRYMDRKPYRKTGHKWTVSKAEYPHDIYPPYIFGGFVVMSMTTVEEFSIAAMYTKLFKFEDVFLGILANNIGLNVTMNVHVSPGAQITSKDKNFKTLIASHSYVRTTDLLNNWECHLNFLDHTTKHIIFCEYIRELYKEIKSKFEDINQWVEK